MANKYTPEGRKMASDIANDHGNEDNYIPSSNPDTLIEMLNRRSRRKGVEKMAAGSLADNLTRDQKMLNRQGY